jgi:hydrogenase/urease accessory protein HupE
LKFYFQNLQDFGNLFHIIPKKLKTGTLRIFMQEFIVYLKIGFHHLLGGLDHLAFLVALCGVYQAKDWNKFLGLVTAFAFGHSVTLILVSLNAIQISHKIIEPIIPITILVTGLYNLFASQNIEKSQWLRYLMALSFGLLHGLAFGNDFKTLKGDDFLLQLFAFNIGLEFAQLLVVSILVTVSFVLVKILKLPFKWWKTVILLVAIGISIQMLTQRF